MKSYRAVKPFEARTVIERSVFLTFACPISDEAEAQQRIAALRARFADATHVCYGYVADPEGTLHRFSDDGEPSGTAGMPILEVIKANGLACSLIAVVRWFGGIKLGAGGLTRAYAGCAADAVRGAGIDLYRQLRRYDVTVSFSDQNKIKKIPHEILCKTGRIEYNDSVRMELWGDETLPEAVVQATCGRAVVTAGPLEYAAMEEMKNFRG